MKTLLLLAALSCAGCSTTNVARIIEAMGKDPATVHVSIRSVYGVVEIYRVNAGTNSVAHSINADGTITVEKVKP
jgi:hypothetical protein